MISAIARAGFIEALRNRVTVIIVAFLILLILMSQVVVSVTALTLDRAITDFGLGLMAYLLVALALYLSIGTLQRDFDRRSLVAVLSRPIGRHAFILGRYLGVFGTLTVILAVMTAVYVAQLLVFSVPLTSAVAASILGLWVELAVLSALGFFFSTFSGAVTSLTCVVALYFIGHAPQGLYAASSQFPALLRTVTRGIYWLVPNLDRLDFRPQAAHLLAVPLSDVAASVAYGIGWTGLLLVATIGIFSIRDVR